MSADLVLINAKVRTMKPRQPLVEAVAIRQNKIIKVGTTQEINYLVGKGTKVVNLNGKTVVPGLIDTHIHLADFGRCLLWLDLTSADSIKELQQLLYNKVRQTPSGRWIVGRGWNQNRFKENRLPTFSDLDKVAPDNPIILYHEAAMICVVNSTALTIASVTKQTVPPEGGTIDKDPLTGELTGVLRDTATNLIWQSVAVPTLDELTEVTAMACQKVVEAGITSVHWILLSQIELDLIQRLQAEDKLPIRVNVIVPYGFLNETIDLQPTDSSMLHVGGILIMTDGYLDSKTAALKQPYKDDANNSGKMLLDETELTTSVKKVLKLGYQPVVHAMGDKAIEIVLNVIEQVASAKGRFRIEQAAVLNERLIACLKSQKVVVSVQPKVISTEFEVWSAKDHLGLDRVKLLHPLKTLLKEGIRVAGGSDCPMEPLSPLIGMQETVLRASFPQQRLTAEEALSMYTINAAYCSCEEHIKGSIEEGKLADLTILSDDPLSVPSNEIEDVTIESTIINGSFVYSKKGCKL